ncbi:MAG: hypothetical protein ABI610_03855 [Acidobacteriota bacterium]
MSRPYPLDAETPVQTNRKAPFPGISCPWIHMLEPMPPEIHSDLRTVDPEPATRAAETIDEYLMLQRAGATVEQLHAAAAQKQIDAAHKSCFGFFETRNEITGESGIIVRRMLAPGRISRALAEVLAPSGVLTTETGSEAHRLGWNAARGRLLIVVYEDPRPAVFAAIPGPESSELLRFSLLARLLVTDFEICQWSLPLDEALTDSLN